MHSCRENIPVLEALRLHIGTHLRFFARSRLLLGLAIVLGALWGLGLVAFLMMASSSDRFDMLKTISEQLRSFGWFYTGATGLFALWWHTTHRSTSLVFTRPGPPEVWLASIFASAIILAIAIHAVGLLTTVILCVSWSIPLEPGFLWLSVDAVFESMILVSVLTGLGTLMHPALVILVVAFFTESLFLWFDTMLLGYMEAYGAKWWVAGVEWAVRAVHSVAPMLDPFAKQTREVANSMRVSVADWTYLAGTGGYALVMCFFWFMVANYKLRRTF